jgi:hypothetical protein
MGLDQPVHVRYVRWMGSMLQGDFGMSFARNQPVRDVIRQILPNTLVLSFARWPGLHWRHPDRGPPGRAAELATDGVLSVVVALLLLDAVLLARLMLILVFSLGAGTCGTGRSGSPPRG